MRDRIRGGGKQGIVAGLDIGTTKIACFIARPVTPKSPEDPPLKVLGVGHQVSRGIRKGVVTDIQAAEEAVRAAVDAAERMAGVVVQKVWVNFNHTTMQSRRLSGAVALNQQPVTAQDIRRGASEALANGGDRDIRVLHAVPMGYAIDGTRGIDDPRGMMGNRLGVSMHFITASNAAVRNLTVAVRRCHLEVAGHVATPYASALGALIEDEMDLGCTLIDMGGGTTSVAVFYEGRLVFTDVLGVGGGHVTSDIARGLSTPMAEAERLKTLYGSVLSSSTDDRELIEVPQIAGESDGMSNQVPRSLLTGIIQPRVEETLELVKASIARSGLEDVAGGRVVLTGGASELTGVRELASRMLSKQVRSGRPVGLQGLPGSVGGAAFTACAGVLAYPTRAHRETLRTDRLHGERGALGGFSTIGRWLKANF